jgi:hypothetical protein
VQVLGDGGQSAAWKARRKGAAFNPPQTLEVVALVSEPPERSRSRRCCLASDAIEDQEVDKQVRKRRQIETANKTSSRAKIFKLLTDQQLRQLLIKGPGVTLSCLHSPVTRQ